VSFNYKHSNWRKFHKFGYGSEYEEETLDEIEKNSYGSSDDEIGDAAKTFLSKEVRC